MANDLTRKYKPGEDLVLGPEFWQDLFRDLDRRLDTIDGRAQNIDEILLQARDIALARVNELILPIFLELEYRASVGFLTANSDEGVALDEDEIVSLYINDDNEAKYFKPTEFTALTRRSTHTNFAIMRTVEWDAEHKIYVGQIIAVFGPRGPWNDWQISAVAGSTVAQKEMLDLAVAAKLAAQAALLSIQGIAEQIQNDKNTVLTARAETTAARDVTVNAKNVVLTAKTDVDNALAATIAARDVTTGARDTATAAATTATTQAGTATTKAGEAAASATTAVSARDAAIGARDAAIAARNTTTTARDVTLAAVSSYNEVYLGAHATDPSTDNAGQPLVEGATYWNSTSKQLKGYDGTGWIVQVVPLGSEVVSIFGRGGVVSAAVGDYSAEKISAYQAISGLSGSTVHALFQSVAAALAAINSTNASQQTKLDGIEAGATADMTAAEILAAIKTVDGLGSGLDAALLEGQAPSFYRNAGNMNAGTLPDPRLPARVGTVAATVTDWNNAVENGWYMASGAANAPEGGAVWFMGTAHAHNTNWVTQTVHLFTADGSVDTRTYRRAKNNGTWESWYRLRLSEAEQSALYLTLTGAQTITGPKTFSGFTATTAFSPIALIPTDVGPGKPGLYLKKSATAGVWGIELWDGSSSNGTLNIQVQNFTLNGVAIATLASPTFTGVPLAPTPANTINTAQIATAAMVQAVVAALVGNAAATLHLGTFTGSTIADNATVKAALQALETSVEGKARARTFFEVSANTTAVAGGEYRVDTSGGVRTITLPAAPAIADVVVVDRAGANNVIIARNGKTIEGVADDLAIDENGLGVELKYTATTWRVYGRAGAQ
jgi:hypothetical protein